jgi:uncharacterized protein
LVRCLIFKNTPSSSSGEYCHERRERRCIDVEGTKWLGFYHAANKLCQRMPLQNIGRALSSIFAPILFPAVPTIVNACKTVPQRLVSGTSLAAVVSTAAVSAATFAQSGCVDFAAAAIISPIAMLTAPLGANMTTKLNCTALRRILGLFLCAMAPLVPLKAVLLSDKPSSDDELVIDPAGSQPAKATLLNKTANLHVSSGATTLGQSGHNDNLCVLPAITDLAAIGERIKNMGALTVVALAGTGAVAGVASGLLGIGGGTIVTPLLALTQPYGQATVLGTSLLAMIAPSVAGLAQHARLGNVDLKMAIGLAAGTALGGVGGSTLAVQAPPGALEAVFAVGIFYLGRKTLATAK